MSEHLLGWACLAGVAMILVQVGRNWEGAALLGGILASCWLILLTLAAGAWLAERRSR